MFDKVDDSNMVAHDRAVMPAVGRGLRRCCPNCGTGPMMSGYLKVRARCAVCGEELFHARADDGPAYLTILIVGHLVAPFLHVVYASFRPDPAVLATIFCLVSAVFCLYLLPRIKGAIVGYQWAKRMHGF